MYSQLNMFQPILGGLNKIAEEAVPSYLNDTQEPGILLLIDHLCEKTSLVVPERKFNSCT
jgi:hypothetical protein